MVKAVLKSTNTIRFETLNDVENFHEQLKKEALDGGYELTDFKYSVKAVKVKSEIVGEYYICTYTNVLDDVKDPEYKFLSVKYSTESED